MKGIVKYVACMIFMHLLYAKAEKVPCENMSAYENGCNSCVCFENDVLCTEEIKCEFDDPSSTEIKSAELIVSKRLATLCKNGTVTKKDCNTCICLEGINYCTAKACPPEGYVYNKPKEVCSLPVDKGPCEAIIPRYAYIEKSKSCEKFEYGGCLGNANNFKTLEECESACGHGQGQQALAFGIAKPEPGNKCNQPIDSGPCLALIPRYAFIPEKRRCEQFIYGGCEGNENNFKSIGECFNECGGISPPFDICQLPIETGPCLALIKRFAFDPKSGKCEQFTYGGCGGNLNNFHTLEQCQDRCQKKGVCNLPIVIGPCRGAFPSYGYNQISGNCDFFFYGGCEGNANRFSTEEECEETCEGKCPDTSGIVTPCTVSPTACSSHDECPPKQLCCPYGCNNECLEAVYD